MVLTVSFVLSPVTGSFATVVRGLTLGLKPGRADPTSANLTPASGRQDHTTSPYAATSFVSAPFDRSQILSQTRPASRFTPDAAASTASHPASVTIAIRPCSGTGWRELVEMICPTGEAKYFCKWDWTGKLQRRPTGKSLEPAGSNTISPSCSSDAQFRDGALPSNATGVHEQRTACVRQVMPRREPVSAQPQLSRLKVLLEPRFEKTTPLLGRADVLSPDHLSIRAQGPQVQQTDTTAPLT